MSLRSPAPRLIMGMSVLALSASMFVAATPAALAAPGPAAPRSSAAAGDYIVTLVDKPVASYPGGLPGLPATMPAKGRKVNPASRAAVGYRAYLTKQQNAAAARVGVTPTSTYSTALNGFTAKLTPDQAKKLQDTRGVVSVTKNTVRKATDQTNNVDYLKLSGSSGVWSALGGAPKAGRGVVVGVIDSGVWPEATSFAGSALGAAAAPSADPYRPYKVGGTVHMRKADGSEFVGACQTGERFAPSNCNSKLISARYFGAAILQTYPHIDDADFISPRGADGHGTHTASTAAGNAGVSASINGHSLGKISGVAPAAKIAVYKALWQGPDENSTGGFTSDILDAINAAVTDGVDVINYSVGGSTESAIDDPVQQAFFSAAAAGIFVAASAGNSGPDAATLDNTAPWVTTVAATTMAPRSATVRLGNKKSYAGTSTTVYQSVGSAKLVNATAVKVADATASDAAICAADTLNRSKVKGRIVVCDRGGVDRVAKSAEVKRAGGVGMILVNLTNSSLEGDTHSVATVQLNPPASQAVKTYAKKSGATATLRKGNQTRTKIPYPQVAAFSSRGPSAANGADLLKPDLAAPGVAVLAAYAPVADAGRNFQFESGTSMAAPQVAGLAALYLSRFPTMAPMSIKSALMTTAASTITASGKTNTDAYAQGAGQVRADRMFNPGVVFGSGVDDWLGYLEGQGLDTESGATAINPSDLNTASIAVGQLAGAQTVTRRVTSVKPGVYRTTASVPGFTAQVVPSVLKFTAAGQTRTIKVRFTRTAATFGQAAFGSVRLAGAGTTARVPVALTPVAVDAPAEIAGHGAAGSVTYPARPGVSGPFTTRAFGLVASQRLRGSVSADADAADYPLRVPAGNQLSRFTLVADQRDADIDLIVYKVVDGLYEEVGASAGFTGDETVTLLRLAAGAYVVSVQPISNGAGASATTFTLTNSLVPTTPVQHLSVTSAQPGVAGREMPVTATWSGLVPDAPYLGYIVYADGSGTVLTVS